jgi:RHS repeat-associated protein
VVPRSASTVGATDASGNPCYEATYTPYGQETALLNTCPQNYKVTGYERDAETGLDYAFARYYNQRIGRFMSLDPMAGDIHDPQTLNRYAYVRNNPGNLTDPSGLAGNCTNNPDYYCGYYALNSNSLGHRPDMNCILDGAEESCDRVFNLMEKGSAARCPNDNCTNLLYTSEGWKKFSAEVFITTVNLCKGTLDNCRMASFKMSSRWVLTNAGPVAENSLNGTILGRMLDPKQCPVCNVGRTLGSANDWVTVGTYYTGAGIATVVAAPVVAVGAEVVTNEPWSSMQRRKNKKEYEREKLF